MNLDILTIGEALVEIMRTGIDQPLDRPGPFTGPYPSGAPFIFAAQAARLGAHVAAIGSVGADAFGRCLINQLHEDGIDASGIQILSTHTTGAAFVAYDAVGSRDFVFHVPHSAAGQISPDMLQPELFEGLKCLHLMGSTLSIHQGAIDTGLRALELAQAAGAKISFDPNLRPQMLPHEQARVKFQPFVTAADVLIPTADEACILTGESDLGDAVTALLDSNPNKIIILTQGADGCTAFTTTKQIHVPGFAVTEVDPTGAGDCFDAGFLVQWLNGATLEQAARFANACGALAVTQQGPMAGAQTLANVQVFINNQLGM
jgi:sugar/nucleoside kinase (ribokinase family)